MEDNINTDLNDEKPVPPQKEKSQKMEKAKNIAQKAIVMIKKIITIGLILFAIIVAFLLGARMNDVGFLAGKFGKDLKGATVFLSGKCMVEGRERLPAFGNDSVKIISVNAEQVEGVVVKTREYITCKTADITTDMIPLLKDMMKSPESFPELQEARIPVVIVDPAIKRLEKTTQLISGTCVTLDDKFIPTFTDERVDVTEIAIDEKNPKMFSLAGVKRSDKVAIKCVSSAISWKDAGREVAPEVPEKLTYVGKIVEVTGRCFPEGSGKINKKAGGIGFFKMANSQVQVVKEKFDEDGNLQHIIAVALDSNFRGDSIECDQKKFPFTISEGDSSDHEIGGGMATDTQKINVKKVLEAQPIAPKPLLNLDEAPVEGEVK